MTREETNAQIAQLIELLWFAENQLRKVWTSGKLTDEADDRLREANLALTNLISQKYTEVTGYNR